MKSSKINSGLILRIFKDEEILTAIKQACKKNKIVSGYFHAIGAVSSAKLSSYNLQTKRYISKEFLEPLEISSLFGNISQLQGELILHTHVTFGKQDFNTISGHLDQAIVSATCEVIITKLDIQLNREFDPSIGLNLLKLE